MEKLLLLGDEAIAQAALDGGLSGAYAYPGTPSTEITEYIQHNKYAKEHNIHRDWSANEKTAVESAIGMSYAGKRSIVCMKHVGLNVAADAFMNSAITGVNGGMLVVVADDPSMHSSQNEQDSRYYADFAMIPILEPSDQQEAYDMVYSGFELSEQLNVPVMIRITTRLAHSRASVQRKPQQAQNTNKLPEDLRQFVLLPSIAKRNYNTLLKNQSEFKNRSEQSPFNQYTSGTDKSRGIICSGIAYNYLKENYGEQEIPYPVLKICQYPLPTTLIKKIYDECQELLILEEGYPLIESKLAGLFENPKIKGRLTSDLPRDGELNPNLVAIALKLEEKRNTKIPDIVASRPPALCMGCGHTDVFKAVNQVVETYGEGRVFADIGCYTLSALPPLQAINTCVDMGASITMAKGAADAGMKHVIAFIGDSTFTHSGMTGLLDCVIENTPITIIISDNDTTGMTGGQHSHAENRLFQICKGIGVPEEHIRTFVPLKKNHAEAVQILTEELEYEGVSVIIPHRECVRTFERKNKQRAKKKKQEASKTKS
ncbi:MAG: indolepyruvate ferredoxin oxidoreductase [Bacteroidia bacterium]|nr:MAG: indolepyruvate ferredoxin oxidoreductase [Bacteroidia bacterium]